jgi:aspartate ammonia-lyase
MGATANRHRHNAPKGYAEKVAAHLATITGKPIVLAPEHDCGDVGPDRDSWTYSSRRCKSVADQDLERLPL